MKIKNILSNWSIHALINSPKTVNTIRRDWSVIHQILTRDHHQTDIYYPPEKQYIEFNQISLISGFTQFIDHQKEYKGIFQQIEIACLPELLERGTS